uniref:DUF2510 domain-containing protein n=1 Tax=Thermobifida fusca TaxID=2021 RepID=UPI00131DC838
MGGSIEPGWYADPEGAPGQLRWWNGSEWTHHVRPLSEFTSEQHAAEESAATQHTTGADQGASSEETIDLSGGGPSPVDATVRLDPAAAPSPDNDPTADLTPNSPAGDSADQTTVNLGDSPADQATINLGNTPSQADATMRLDPEEADDAP